PEPAVIVEKAEPMRVTIGDACTLECKVAGTPELSTGWFKDGKELTSSQKYRITFLNKVATLKIMDAEKEDGGLYTFAVQNDVGKSSCTASVDVLEPPVFSKVPSPVDTLKGSDVILQCEIAGTPPFEVAWFKDRRQVRSSKKFKVTAKHSVASLHILNLESQDTGEYQCKAMNEVGKSTTSRLSFLDLLAVPLPSTPVMLSLLTILSPSLEPPYFVTHLERTKGKSSEKVIIFGSPIQKTLQLCGLEMQNQPMLGNTFVKSKMMLDFRSALPH
uniref:Ig-like domain-containing protein n=1 Tax=Calidris pygmaea TaxID=425635 RepID=A0A8C3KIA3_9CHAR